MTASTKKSLFISYAWDNNKEGDFDFIVQELDKVGLDVQFDRRQLIPGRRLWEQIGHIISRSDIDGWAYLVTRQSLASNACVEEYYLALQRAIETKGDAFPLIALVHGAAFADLPPSLKIRLGVSLQQSDWVEYVVAGLEGRPPSLVRQEIGAWFLKAWRTPESNITLEFRPRLGVVYEWRVAFPDSHSAGLLGWSEGASNNGLQSMMLNGAIDYTDTAILDVPVQYRILGAHGPIGGGHSAYITFRGDLVPPEIQFEAHDFPTQNYTITMPPGGPTKHGV